MIYQIKILNKARKQIRALPQTVQIRILEKIATLSAHPRPSEVKKLSGVNDLYRLRVGNYRIIYQIEDEILLIILVSVEHRREIYRSL